MKAIDGTRIKEYLSCPRIAWLTFHPPPGELVPPSPRMELLWRSGHRVELRLLATFAPHPVRFPDGDFAAGQRATVALMAERVPAIAGGVLASGRLLGRPDLLLLDEDGDGYEVADIKSSQTLRAAAVLQVAFYSTLLARTGRATGRGWVITRDGTRQPVEVAELSASVSHLVERLDRMRSSKDRDPGPSYTETCLDCRFRRFCLDDLRSTGDIALLPALTRAQAAALRGAGVADLVSLAGTGRRGHHAARDGLAPDILPRLAAQARALLTGRPQPLGKRPATRDGRLAAAGIALAALYAERQSEPAVAVAGMVPDDPDRFRVRFLRRREVDDPRTSLGELLSRLGASRGPILVFGADVERTLEEAARSTPAHAAAVGRLQPRLLDLRAALRREWALPGFDRTPAQAARAAGVDAGDDAVDLEALGYLEEDPAVAAPAAIERLLRRDLEAMIELRHWLLTEAAGP